MIIGADRSSVIDNIRRNVQKGELNAKVETGDPIISNEEEKRLVARFLAERKGMSYKFKSAIARIIANSFGWWINRKTEFVGDVDDSVLKKGAIITSNHFSPLENTVIRNYLRRKGAKKLNVVSQVTNFAMKGFLGFLMNYADTVPIGADPRYLSKTLVDIIGEKIGQNEFVLIYPEQEMWFNYRKPRPHKEGAYHYAARIGAPIISCFVEILNEDALDNDDFYKTRYRLHVLGVLYPDESKSVRENRIRLCEKDYQMKKAAYERIYGKPLTYEFSSDDIAGWINYAEWL